MKFLAFLFILGLLVFALALAFGFSFVRGIFRFIFGTGNQPQAKSSSRQNTKQTNKQQKTPSDTKIFKQEEGEYVDFEEIKD